MSFTEHLGELRNRVLKSVLAVAIGFGVAYAGHQHVFRALARPVLTALRDHGIHSLQALQVTEAITVYLQVSLIAGLFLASPYLIWQVWAFVAPGLLERERRFVVPILAGVSAFFALGVVFCYFVFLPMVVDFLVGFSLESGDISLVPTVQKTFSLTATFLGVFGLVFEMPLLMFFLALMGVVTHQRLLKFGRYFVVLSFILAAVFTPPDPMSQTLMALPLCVLYFVGTAFAWVAGLMRRRKGSVVAKGTLVLVFSAFAATIGMSAWLWQRAREAPSAVAPLGPDVTLALRADTRGPSGIEAWRRLRDRFSGTESAGADLLVSLRPTGLALDRVGDADCPPPGLDTGASCRVLGPASMEGDAPEGFEALDDRQGPVVLVVGRSCLAHLLASEAPEWMAARAIPNATGRWDVSVRFAPGPAATPLIDECMAAADRIGPEGPPSDLDRHPLGRVIAWSGGDLTRLADGFALTTGPNLAGRILGELAQTAVARCLTPQGAHPEATP